jgi:hypothetical protein
MGDRIAKVHRQKLFPDSKEMTHAELLGGPVHPQA